MHMAFSLHCADGPLLLIGTDCPTLNAADMRHAARSLLSGDDAVFYPAEDGGYALVGLREPQPSLFTEMTWSTSTVMSETRSRAHAAGLRIRELGTVWDLDTPADLNKLTPSEAVEFGLSLPPIVGGALW